MSKLRTLDFAFGGSILLLILNILFFPVIWGGKTLLSSALGLASIMPDGAFVQPPIAWLYPPRSGDPGGAGWFSEPFYSVIHRSLFVEHSIPLWNPYAGCGVPLLANMQSQVLNPLQAIAWLHPGSFAADIYVLARLLVAGVLTFLFLRLFLWRAPAMLGAIAFMLTGYLILYLGMPDISVCVVIPGLFWGLERLVRRNEFKSIAIVAAFAALILLGGMPEVSFLAIVLGTIYFAARVFVSNLSHQDRSGTCLSLLLAYVSGFLFSAPMVFPFLEYLQNSFNAHDLKSMEAPGLAILPAWSLHAMSYVTPLIFGPLGQAELRSNPGFDHIVGYWGTSVLLLAMMGITASFGNLRRKHSRTIAVCAVFSFSMLSILLLKKFGFPLVQGIGLLPIFKLVVYWKYGEPFIGFAIACLAAIGLQLLLRKEISLKQVIAVGGGFALIIVGLCILNAPYTVPTRMFRAGLIQCLVVAASTLGIAGAMVRRPRQFGALGWCCVAIVAIDLSISFVVPTFYKFSPLPPRVADPYKGAPYIEFLRSNIDNDRIMGYDSVLYPNWSSAFSLPDIRNQDAMYPGRYFPFLQAFAYGSNVPELPLGNHNLTTRFDGEEIVLDPLQKPDNFSRIAKLWQLTSSKFIVGVMPRIVRSETAEMRAIVANNKQLDKDHFKLLPVNVGGETKFSIFTHSFTDHANVVNLPLVLPKDHPRLQFAIGFDSEAVKRGITDGAEFRVFVTDKNGRQLLKFGRFMDPVSVVADRVWLRVQLDMSEFAGQDVVIQLSVEPGPKSNSADDRAAWADIQVDSTSSSVEHADKPSLINLRNVYAHEVNIYSVPDVLPRAALFRQIEEVSTPEEALKRLVAPDFDIHQKAVIESPRHKFETPLSDWHKKIHDTTIHLAEPKSRPVGVEAAHILSYAPHRVIIETNSEHKSLLVLNDTFFPGWVVRVNGLETEILHANYLFRGVMLEPGVHTIEFSYEPESFRLGLLGALAGTVLLLGVGLWKGRSKDSDESAVEGTAGL